MENNLNELRDLCHKQAVEKGFWEKPSEFGTLIALVHSELSEALEADRKGKICKKWNYNAYNIKNTNRNQSESFLAEIKDTVQDELADAIIRICDMFGANNWDMDFHIKEKLKYNKTRGYKHGKEY